MKNCKISVVAAFVCISVVLCSCGGNKKKVKEGFNPAYADYQKSLQNQYSYSSNSESEFEQAGNESNFGSIQKDSGWKYIFNQSVECKYSDSFIPYNVQKTLPPVMYVYNNEDEYSIYATIEEYSRRFYNNNQYRYVEDGTQIIPVCYVDDGEPIDGSVWVKVLFPHFFRGNNELPEFGYMKLSNLSEYKVKTDFSDFTDEQIKEFIWNKAWEKTDADGVLDYFFLQKFNNDISGNDYTGGVLDSYQNGFDAEVKNGKLKIEYDRKERQEENKEFNLVLISDDEIKLDGVSYFKTINAELSFSSYGTHYAMFDTFNGKTFMAELENLVYNVHKDYFENAEKKLNYLLDKALAEGVYCGGTRFAENFDDMWKAKIEAANETIEKENYIDTDEFYNKVKPMLYPLKNKVYRQKHDSVPENLMHFYNGYSGKLKAKMQVDSTNGLNIRSTPDMNAEKLLTVPDNFILYVVALGEPVTIDGIESAWVEVVLPRFLWGKDEAISFGWVFGGYLKEYEKNVSLSLTGYIPEKAGYVETQWENYSEFSSLLNDKNLYDIDRKGMSILDRFFEEMENKTDISYIKSSKERNYYYAQQRQKVFPEYFSFIQAGVADVSEGVFSGNAEIWWHEIQKTREIFPCDLGLNKSFENEEIDSIAKKQFSKKDYKCYSLKINDEDVYALMEKERVRDSELLYHEVYTLHLFKNGNFEKKYRLVTDSDIIFEATVVPYVYDENLTISYVMQSLLNGFMHDDVIFLK